MGTSFKISEPKLGTSVSKTRLDLIEVVGHIDGAPAAGRYLGPGAFGQKLKNDQVHHTCQQAGNSMPRPLILDSIK